MPVEVGSIVRTIAKPVLPESGHDAPQQAFDDFARRHDRAVLALPTGQGLLVK